MISSEIQFCRLLFTVSCITSSYLFPQYFESVSGLLIILLLSITVIPHGALDHIVFYQLYHNRHKNIPVQSSALAAIVPQLIFYSHYLGIMILWGISWQYQMSLTFMVFLVLSAYHFGEGDLDYIKLKSIHQQILFLSRGIFLLSLAILTRPKLTISIVERFIKVPNSLISYGGLNHLMVFQHFSLLIFYLGLSSILDLKDCKTGQFPVTRQDPKYKVWIYEIAKAALFWILFNSMNPLVGFLIYLGPWHSIGHMLSEICSLKQCSNRAFSPTNCVDWTDIARFLYLTAPFTLIALSSMTGAYFLAFGLQSLTMQDVNAWAVFVISISVLTGPHLWVVAAMHYDCINLDPLMIKRTISLMDSTLSLTVNK